MGRRRIGNLVAPAVLGTLFAIFNPSAVALQDVTGMIAGEAGDAPRWATVLERAAAGSIQKAQVKFGVDTAVTGAIAGSGVTAPQVGPVVFDPVKAETPDTPDEARINRAEKSGRIVTIAPVTPPKAFNAGTILERQSMILRPTLGEKSMMAFARPEIAGKEILIATAFHVRKDKPKLAPAQDATAIARVLEKPQDDLLAVAYAPPAPDFARRSPFDSLLKKEEKPEPKAFVPPLGRGDHAWAKRSLPKAAFSKTEQKCLAEGIYFEARGESAMGQAAVAQVILNRVRNPAYPNTICGVVYQNDDWHNRCQFSFACDGIKDRIDSPRHWRQARDIAAGVTSGRIWLPEVGSATHYHATYVQPKWASSMKRLSRIGLHIFYRTRGGGWS